MYEAEKDECSLSGLIREALMDKYGMLYRGYKSKKSNTRQLNLYRKNKVA
jgi:hypothetical protein